LLWGDLACCLSPSVFLTLVGAGSRDFIATCASQMCCANARESDVKSIFHIANDVFDHMINSIDIKRVDFAAHLSHKDESTASMRMNSITNARCAIANQESLYTMMHKSGRRLFVI
jgi:hypothetical protein